VPEPTPITANWLDDVPQVAKFLLIVLKNARAPMMPEAGHVIAIRDWGSIRTFERLEILTHL
jgi:hypothetical protein